MVHLRLLWFTPEVDVPSLLLLWGNTLRNVNYSVLFTAVKYKPLEERKLALRSFSPAVLELKRIVLEQNFKQQQDKTKMGQVHTSFLFLCFQSEASCSFPTTHKPPARLPLQPASAREERELPLCTNKCISVRISCSASPFSVFNSVISREGWLRQRAQVPEETRCMQF